MSGKASPVPVTTTAESVSAAIFLTKVANWDGKSQDIQKALIAAFGAKDYLECVGDLQAQDIEPQSYINNLDKIVYSLPAGSDFRKRCIRALRKTCGFYGIFPAHYEVTSALQPVSDRAWARGGFAEVWRYTDEKNQNQKFAVKILRVYERDSIAKINKQYCKEVVVCKLVDHPNVMSIEGVAAKSFKFGFSMVSQWMENGNLLEYMTKYPGANRLDLLIGVARGLSYLHSDEVIHGDLKGENILVDMGGSPRLTDFGLCSITKNIDSVNASTPNHGCTVRYRAPELLDVEGVVVKKKVTFKADVYSLSMVVVELATGQQPYPKLLDPAVIIRVSKGKRPRKPDPFEAPGMSEAVWKIAKKCWHGDPKERPEAKTTLQYLENTTTVGDKRSSSSLGRLWREVFPN